MEKSGILFGSRLSVLPNARRVISARFLAWWKNRNVVVGTACFNLCWSTGTLAIDQISGTLGERR